MRSMGLDLGTKTLGVALSDPSGIIAQGLMTHFFPEGDYEHAAAFALELIGKHQVGAVILGHPRNMDGTSGFQAQISEAFQARLAQMTTVPVILWDERLTTRIAQFALRGAKPKDKKQKVDQLAAAVLLQSYLDSKKGV